MVMMSARNSVRLAGFVAVCAAGLASAAAGADEAAIEAGRRDFQEHCAACHGSDAKGNGPASLAILDPLPDLTRLRDRDDEGKFPTKRLRWVIDGRVEVLIHGSRTMPVWGNAFRRDEGLDPAPAFANQDKDVRERIDNLIEYLRSIQQASG